MEYAILLSRGEEGIPLIIIKIVRMASLQ